MIQLTKIEAFRASLSDAVLIRGDDGCDEARSAWNGEIDRYPAVIARCADAADVAAAIGFARQLGLEISVRGGFHNTAGVAVCDNGVMIGLSLLRQVRVADGRQLRAAAEEHAGVLVPLRAALPPLFEFVTPMPYVQLQQMIDGDAQWGRNTTRRPCTSTSCLMRRSQ
jgi:hypothetical protein